METEKVHYEYSIEYLDQLTEKVVDSSCWSAPITSLNSALDNRFLVGRAYREFISFKTSGVRKDYFQRRFSNPDNVKVAVFFSWWNWYDKRNSKKSIELTQTLQTDIEQLKSLKSEFDIYKMFFPKCEGPLLSEFIGVKELGEIAVVDKHLFLENNNLVKPIKYYVEIDVVDDFDETIYTISRCFDRDSSYTNRLQALFFLGGVYALINNQTDQEPRHDQTILFFGKKCRIKRRLTISKFNNSEENISLVLTNDFSDHSKILYLLHQEFEWYDLMNINVVSGIRSISNDYFTWGVGRTGHSFPNDYSEGLIWHRRPETQLKQIVPSEQLRTGSLYLNGELPIDFKLYQDKRKPSTNR